MVTPKTPRARKPTPSVEHASDCAVHNEPALPAGPCDCDAFNGADPAKFDHDGDGKPGGSRPKGALIEHELAGLFAEAFEAYDMMGERLRFDSLGRRWDFYPDKAGDHSVLRLKVTRLEDVREDTISTAMLASDLGKPMVEDVVRALDRALA